MLFADYERSNILMLRRALSRAVASLLLVAALLSVVGCGNETGQVAATVNGEAIPESVVTDYIEGYISSLGYDSNQWAQYLGIEGKTAAEFREGVIDYYANYLLYEQKGKELGIQVTDDQVDAAVSDAREKLGRDDEGWVQYLANQGYTEDTYRATVAYSLLVTAIQAKEIPKPELTDEQRSEFADAHVLTYDAKHVRGIKFGPDEYSEAEDVLKEILSAQDQPAAFLERIALSKDDELVANEGDLGWSCLVSYGQDWTELVGDLEEGKVYPYVYQSGDACYLLYCDDGYAPAFYGDADKAVENMPDEIRAVYDEDLERWSFTQATEEYTQSLRDSAEIVVNDMPSGLPYDVQPIRPQGSAGAK